MAKVVKRYAETPNDCTFAKYRLAQRTSRLVSSCSRFTEAQNADIFYTGRQSAINAVFESGEDKQKNKEKDNNNQNGGKSKNKGGKGKDSNNENSSDGPSEKDLRDVGLSSARDKSGC